MSKIAAQQQQVPQARFCEWRGWTSLIPFQNMKPLLDGAMELPLDKYRIRIDELEGKLASEKERADKMSVEAERLRKELEELKKNK